MMRLAAALAFSSTALAHFTLDFPLSRGFDDDIEPQFCGGFPNVTGRTVFPLGPAPILFDSHHDAAKVEIIISPNPNPQNFSVFNVTSSGATIPPLKPFFDITNAGEFCINVDISSLGVSDFANGTNATIQVVYNGGDGPLYQCADVTLSTEYTASNITCANSTATNTNSTGGGDAPASGNTGGGSWAFRNTQVDAKVAGLAALVAAGVMALM
ncbi:hypothetical protein BT69DRAFT_1347631 [Atractiella rhizophila]|nr:hypothetical protein BT69DRAFT_1347631 [Atractiella rhizophila]